MRFARVNRNSDPPLTSDITVARVQSTRCVVCSAPLVRDGAGWLICPLHSTRGNPSGKPSALASPAK